MGRNQNKIFTTGREIITMSEGQLELELGTVTNENHKYKKISDLDMYQQVAKTTAIYPREQAIIYPTLGLTGEAGEVANKVKMKNWCLKSKLKLAIACGISLYWLMILTLSYPTLQALI